MIIRREEDRVREGVARYYEQRRNGQVAGDEDKGAQLSGSVGTLDSCLFSKRHTTRTAKPDDAKIRRKTRGGQGSDIETQIHSDGRTPHGSIGTLAKADVFKGESKIHMGMASGVGMRRRDKR